ncbi:MAG TPA: hypothetical protein VLB81_15060 [Gaiellales bacterium]|nr:hypothetical protein [Gaiellales bacterium]
MTIDTNLRLPAAELAKLEPARPRASHHIEPPVDAEPAPRRLRRAVRHVVGFARA